eukprot:CAMPEP_0116577810 /NCGR_PEP_ID=MMETSP0397-20121206/21351_1 /TAXON_ID=216820 /ORGANISM="Cyclophora tenuis, Strain ECT3854" /LENGTH=217 /DNA_ID=CAMNT_0004107117 /DNA_START=148 /DNA_END=798 /DNA_ORIENTATION=-
MVFDQCLTYSHYNLHDTSLMTRPITTDKEEDDKKLSYADYCEKHSITLLAAAPLSMGLLTHAGPPEWHPANQSLQDACRQAASICEQQSSSSESSSSQSQQAGVNISTLAIVFALSNSTIPCTVLGMKNVEQVRIAAEAAKRFLFNNNVDVIGTTTTPANTLPSVLTKQELDTWIQLKNDKTGPFATIWKDGQFRWDGVKDVHSFWESVEGVEATHW